ncbi:hypothetical protein [Candidatus Odyssella acanthamoebae]|uniref:hypothetical protein n=1 Tax=Candidatus Odyssella acanthamoebae TaxID=91604 RepID=UPI0012EC32AC|nr:hypothetical protein [Candidatus Paracaedibacter acanthamoebae]
MAFIHIEAHHILALVQEFDPFIPRRVAEVFQALPFLRPAFILLAPSFFLEIASA